MRSALVILLLLSAGTAFGQAKIVPGGVTLETEHDVPTGPEDVGDALESPDGDEAGVEPGAGNKKAGRELVAVPMPGYDPQQGWKITLPAFYLYQPSSEKTDGKVWITGLSGMYTQNESWALGAFHRMNLADDTWRLMFTAGHADVNYDYFGRGESADFGPIPLNQRLDIAAAKVLYRVWPGLYAGLKLVYVNSDIGLNIPGEDLPDGITPQDLAFGIDLVDLVPRIEYDTRDQEFYPTRGTFIQAQVAFSRDAFGSDADFEKYLIKANYYRPLGSSGVLASRIRADYASDGAPFFVVPAFGSDVDLRGYKSGTYRDNFLLAGQVEYRHRFTDRYGAVAFAGLGTVADDVLEWGETLYSIGLGFRYQVAPVNNISVRVDVAWGRDDNQVYLGIGEAF